MRPPPGPRHPSPLISDRERARAVQNAVVIFAVTQAVSVEDAAKRAAVMKKLKANFAQYFVDLTIPDFLQRAAAEAVVEDAAAAAAEDDGEPFPDEY